MAKTTAAAPPRPRDIIDTAVVEIGPGRPLACLPSGEGFTTSTGSHLRAVSKTRHVKTRWPVPKPSTNPEL